MLRPGKGFLFLIVSPDLAKVHGLGRQYVLALLLIFAMIVALGIKLVGTLLTGALTIIPAAVAKNASRSMRGYVILSAVLGGVLSVEECGWLMLSGSCQGRRSFCLAWVCFY